jgi:hypothetical protein
MGSFEILTIQLNQKLFSNWLYMLINFWIAKDNADFMKNSFELLLI